MTTVAAGTAALQGGGQVIAIMGPTASGKTALGVALAGALDGELVNADSRQAIAELAVGVCKPTEAELRGIPCHGLDWSHLGDRFSAGGYRILATRAIEEVFSRARVPLLVGGTGLYIRALLDGFDFGGLSSEPTPALGWQRPVEAAQQAEIAAADLLRLDPGRAATLDMRNRRRVTRAADLARAGAQPGSRRPPWESLRIGCRVSAELLSARIAERSETLIGDPLAAEVEGLLSQGFTAEVISRSAIGYAEIVDWMGRRCRREEAVKRVVSRTWRYARAQMTWLRGESELVWIDAETTLPVMVRDCLALIGNGRQQRVN